MNLTVTIQDLDNAQDMLWDAVVRIMETHGEDSDPKEDYSMALIEVTNVAYLLGKQDERMSVA